MPWLEMVHIVVMGKTAMPTKCQLWLACSCPGIPPKKLQDAVTVLDLYGGRGMSHRGISLQCYDVGAAGSKLRTSSSLFQQDI